MISFTYALWFPPIAHFRPKHWTKDEFASLILTIRWANIPFSRNAFCWAFFSPCSRSTSASGCENCWTMEDRADEMIDTSASKANCIGLMDSERIETVRMRDTRNKRNNKRECAQKIASAIEQISPKFNYTHRRRRPASTKFIRRSLFARRVLAAEIGLPQIVLSSSWLKPAGRCARCLSSISWTRW